MAEAVGVVLGVASLVFATVESYHTATAFFTAIKHHPRKLKEALSTLRMQELCFRKANERLLSYCVDTDEARQMLQDPNHVKWHDGKIAREYVLLFGVDQQGFEAAIIMVCDKLDAVREEFEDLGGLEGTPVKVVRKRLRFAFEQSRIEKALCELVEKTQNFVVLTNLVAPQPQARETSGGKIISSSLRKELQRFSTVKQTAEDLYVALGSACKEHDDHKAFLSLNPVCSDANQIRFTLAFSQLTLRAPKVSSDGEPICLRVESSTTGLIASARNAKEGFGTMATRMKRTFAGFEDEDTESSTKGK